MAYELVKDVVSRDTVEALETLLAGAKSGQITGIAFACTMPKMRYFTNVAGACYRNPTFARGMIGALNDELAALVHGHDPQGTR